jgi:hypothetical protein
LDFKNACLKNNSEPKVDAMSEPDPTIFFFFFLKDPQKGEKDIKCCYADAGRKEELGNRRDRTEDSKKRK